MKKILLACFILFSLSVNSQTVTDWINIKNYFKLSTHKITSITSDTTLATHSVNKLPDEYAVYWYVKNNMDEMSTGMGNKFNFITNLSDTSTISMPMANDVTYVTALGKFYKRTSYWSLKATIDKDATNEIQTLSKISAGTYKLTNGAGVASTFINVADSSSTNEIQTLSKISAGTYKLTNPGSPSTFINVADSSATNEIQTLSIVGSNLSISGGNTVTLPSGGTTVKSDLGRLPATYLKIPAKGLAANESVTNYNFASVDITKYKFSSTAMGTSSTEYGGWLANGTSGDSIAVTAPSWVIIGDSQAEGHPNRHGRLHTSGGTVDLTLTDLTGQLSWKLSSLTNMRFFNQGIGGQTTSQVWTRWPRDVLAQTFDPGDSKGSKTLQRKPMGVVIVAGINDFYVAPVKTAQVVFDNLVNMAISCRDNGMQCVILNCPGDAIISMNTSQRIDTLNTLMASGALQELGACVVDYNKWWKSAGYDDNSHKGPYITDDIHPSQAGYDSLGVYIFNSAKLPVLDSVTFYTQISPAGFSGYSRPTGITIQGSSKTLSGDVSTVKLGSLRLTSDSIYIKITASTNISGTSYSGFSHIVWHVRNDTTGYFTKRNQLYNNYVGLSTLWARSGNYISPSTITNKVTIGTTANPSDAYLNIKSSLNTGNSILSCASSTNNNIFNVLDNGRVVVGSTSLGGYTFGVNGSCYIQNTAGTGYNLFNGATWEMYGAPVWKIQSTAINTGSTGYSQCIMNYSGSSLTWQPSGTAGLDLTHAWYNKAGDWGFYINTSTKRMGSGSTSNFNYSVDFSYNTDGMALPRGTTAQRGTVGGSLSPIRYNTDLGKYEVNINPTWYSLITSQDIGAYLPLAGGTMVGPILFTDNTYDIGASGATRPRTGYFGTSLINPLYIGGTSTSSSIIYKTTTGIGTIGADHIFQVGSNGATEAMRILNSGAVGIGTAAPDASSLLHLSSTTKGFLKPVMTTTQRDAISSPATGLSIHNSTNKTDNIYNGEWTDVLAGNNVVEKISNKTTTTTASVTETNLVTTGTWTLTLPSANLIGKVYYMLVKDSGTITIDPESTDTINGLSTMTFTGPGLAITIKKISATEWWVFGTN